MQTQKLDTKRPHGHIWGHPQASYEQDGKLFDGAGEILTGEAPMPPAPKVDMPKDALEIAFLKGLLAGGPMQQATIKRESENEHLIWTDILTAATKLPIEKYKQGTSNMWKLLEV